MSSESFDRNMEIVAAHLASLTVKQEQLQESQARAEARLDRSEEQFKRSSERLDRVERVLGSAIRLGSRQLKETRESVNALIAAQERTTEALARLADSQARTDAKMAETDERLNILVNTVERYISERRNGGGNGSAGGQ
ncbi:MAG TPA: hypothetical protein VF240_15055 [Pyrinomonadaceae bacterium]